MPETTPTNPIVTVGQTYYKVTLPNQKEASFTKEMVNSRITYLQEQVAQWQAVLAQITALEAAA